MLSSLAYEDNPPNCDLDKQTYIARDTWMPSLVHVYAITPRNEQMLNTTSYTLHSSTVQEYNSTCAGLAWEETASCQKLLLLRGRVVDASSTEAEEREREGERER